MNLNPVVLMGSRRRMCEVGAEFTPSVKVVKEKLTDLNPTGGGIEGYMLCLNWIALGWWSYSILVNNELQHLLYSGRKAQET